MLISDADRIRIRPKISDPVPDPDPQHWKKELGPLLRYTHKTSGFKASDFKMSGFKTSETSGLQNVRFT
jgi:hypothetical protein